MIAVFLSPKSGARLGDVFVSNLCVIYLTERRGLKAISVAYCGEDSNAGDGVLQVSDKILDGTTMITLPNQPPGSKHKVCPNCRLQIEAMSR